MVPRHQHADRIYLAYGSKASESITMEQKQQVAGAGTAVDSECFESQTGYKETGLNCKLQKVFETLTPVPSGILSPFAELLNLPKQCLHMQTRFSDTQE